MILVGRVRRVARNGSSLDVHTRAMIDVIEVPPERAVLDAAGHTEVGLRAIRSAHDPAAAGEEVALWKLWTRARGSADDSSGGRADDRVDSREHIDEVQGV